MTEPEDDRSTAALLGRPTVARLATGLLALVVLGAGCTYRAHDGEPLPPAERATVEGVSRFRVVATEGVEIISVDGKRKPVFAASVVELTPGHHSIEVRQHAQFAIFRTSRECVLRFDAVAGREYLVDCKSRGSKLSAWLIDKGTGEWVAECAPIATPKPTASR